MKTVVKTLDLEQLAASVAEFGGLKPTQQQGLALFFRMIEKEGFIAGHRSGRSYSTLDPDENYEQWRAQVKAAEPADSEIPDAMVTEPQI